MAVEVRHAVFDPIDEVRRHQKDVFKAGGKYGATVTFVGTMRDFNDGAAVREMMLEHYPGMTEKHLHAIEQEARGRWDVLDILMLHRVGRILPDEPIVLIAVWSAHRGAAFEACRYLIEELKARAPFWKKEQRADGSRWVESNTPG